MGLTNLPRECSRMIEQPFGVVISRMQMTGKSRYGQAVTWYDYRLNPLIEGNKEGIEKMKEYVASQLNGEQPKEKVTVKEHTRKIKNQPPSTNQDFLF